jgi:hypothetical protein
MRILAGTISNFLTSEILMDLDKAVGNEVFKPLVSIVIPGAVAIAPYVLLAEHYISGTSVFWKAHDAAFVSIVVALAIAIGLMLEDLGGLIEFEIIDRLLDKKTKKHKANWKKYLQLKTKDEYVGQRYIRTVVTRLKFELSMAPALILLGIGIQWARADLRHLGHERDRRHYRFPWRLGGLFVLAGMAKCRGPERDARGVARDDGEKA